MATLLMSSTFSYWQDIKSPNFHSITSLFLFLLRESSGNHWILGKEEATRSEPRCLQQQNRLFYRKTPGIWPIFSSALTSSGGQILHWEQYWLLERLIKNLIIKSCIIKYYKAYFHNVFQLKANEVIVNIIWIIRKLCIYLVWIH